MTTLSTHNPPPLPLALIAQAIPRLTRHELACLTERLIDQLDRIGDDPDDEDDDADEEHGGGGAEPVLIIKPELPFDSASAPPPGRFHIEPKTHDFATRLALSTATQTPTGGCRSTAAPSPP
jgi:hypothetical protein